MAGNIFSGDKPVKGDSGVDAFLNTDRSGIIQFAK